MSDSIKDLMESISVLFEVVAVATIVIGFVPATWRAVRAERQGRGGAAAYRALRDVFARSVLLGLEFLVAADLIRTVAVEPTLDNLYILGLLVLIRTFLSWSLDVEIDGMWPWQKYRLRGRAAKGAGDSES
jgi:uncharacterized membrane protein